jgi:hypothetical protein
MTARFGKSLKSALLLQVRMCSVVIKSFRHGEGYGAFAASLAVVRFAIPLRRRGLPVPGAKG